MTGEESCLLVTVGSVTVKVTVDGGTASERTVADAALRRAEAAVAGARQRCQVRVGVAPQVPGNRSAARKCSKPTTKPVLQASMAEPRSAPPQRAVGTWRGNACSAAPVAKTRPLLIPR